VPTCLDGKISEKFIFKFSLPFVENLPAIWPYRCCEKSHETFSLSGPLFFSLSVLSEDEEDSHDLLHSLSNQESIPEKKTKNLSEIKVCDHQLKNHLCISFYISHTLIKKKIKLSSYIRKIQKGLGVKSYMTNGLLIYDQIFSEFLTYQESLPHI
jgi:hypothetical protein